MDVNMSTGLKILEQNIENPQLDRSKLIKSKLVGRLVCKFWLKTRCKNGEKCDYLHENIPDKYPECDNLGCTGKDCPLKHLPKQVKECQFYSSGYCKDGRNCRLAHIRKEACINYLLGFCPEGPKCKYVHVKTLISPSQDNSEFLLKSSK
jgi:cleavage and polyadenylation specificity factor subunit 4